MSVVKTQGPSSIGERIWRLRQVTGLSQETLGAGISCNVRTIQYWESCGSKPRVQNLIQIAQMTGCDLVWLLTGEVSMGDVNDLSGVPATKRTLRRRND